MKMNIFLKGAALSIAAVAALAASAEPYDYTTKAINAYDHNGKLVSSQIASDINYIEIEDLTLQPETFTISGVEFTMIPVIGTNSYRLKRSTITWSETERTAPIETFYLSQTEVTNALWKAVMGTETVPSKKNTGDDFPVEYVSWDEICKPGGFLDRLNDIVNNNTEMRELLHLNNHIYEFCLPNDWEWEYAASGGNKSKSFDYSGGNDIDSVAWYDVNSASTTHKVMTKWPNELGLYDMSGNVWEWCSANYYRYAIDNEDGTPRIDYDGRVLRGGSFNNNTACQLIEYRAINRYDEKSYGNGIRLALKRKN